MKIYIVKIRKFQDSNKKIVIVKILNRVWVGLGLYEP